MSIDPFNTELFRQEFKFFVNQETIEILRQRLSSLMELDANAVGTSRKYSITSLYFDTPFQEDFEEKVDGVKSREKFRVRIYNEDNNFIKFESKKRVETVIKKRSSVLSLEEATQVIKGDFYPLYKREEPFLKLSYSKLKSSGYQPKVIVEYDREAYTLPYGNIRITFDLNLRTYNTHLDLFDLKHQSMPIFQENLQILEVKHSIPLPQQIEKTLSQSIATRCAISKFVFGQRYSEKLPWRDNIEVPF